MKKTLFLLFLTGYTLSGQAQILRQAIQTIRVKNPDICALKKGYWYQDKCWLHFDKKAYESKKIDLDSVLAAHTDFIKNAHITLNDKEFPIEAFYPEPDNLYFKFSFVFTDDDSQKTLHQRVRKTLIKIRKQFVSEINLTAGDATQLPDSLVPKPMAMGRIQGKYTDFDQKDFTYNGVLRNLIQRGKTYKIHFSLSDAFWKSGSTTLELRGNKAILNGEIGIKTYRQLKDLVNNHLEVRTLILEKIPGSVDANSTQQLVEFIKGYGLNTQVTAQSVLAMEGTKLFLSGRERIVTRGAKIGVNAWDNGIFTGKDLPKDHPAHPYKISFYKDLLKDQAADFYYFTLDTNSNNELKWLDESQLIQWHIATKIIDDVPVIINYPGIPEAIAGLGFSIGNPNSDTVIINAQHNPDTYLYTDSFQKMFTKEGGVDLEKLFVVNVQQAQTLDPKRIQESEISIDQAKQYNQITTDNLAKVVQYFKSQGKKVILIGMSYGGLVVLDMLAKYGNSVDHIFLSACRLDIDDSVREALSNGEKVQFVNGTEPKITEQTSLIDKNKSKLFAAYSSQAYTGLLKDLDLSNCLYVYGKKDEVFGVTTAGAKEFLMKKDALVLSVDKDHNNTIKGFLKKGIQMSLH